MKRFLVPGIPFALSLVLSAATVGKTVGWQDSGFFLTGVKDLGVLYPPGFVLYLLLCRAWTLILGFLDFTLAVHLFSSACAALAAGVLATASRDLVRTRLPDAPAGLAGVVAGMLAASGFTFWSAALLAKGYALFYLLLSLLLWRMIRAGETRTGRDFTIVAALIGLSWAAHPSAATLGLAFVLFVVFHRQSIGGKGIAWRAGLAAACAIGPSLLLPILALREPATMFGRPTSLGAWMGYLAGGRFVGLRGVFGIDSWRVVHALRDLWEEFLAIGLVAALVGLSRLALVDRKLLLGFAAWGLPSALVAVLFRIEGQLDFWLVAAWLPLYLAIAVGIASIPAKYVRIAGAAAGVAAASWAVAANGRAVSQRDYLLAEQFGRLHLEPLEKDALLLLESDDALATTRYLQIVKGVRRDVRIIDAARLGSGWYDDHLVRIDPRLKPGAGPRRFAEANVAKGVPVYFEAAPADLPGLVPCGPLMRLAAEGEANTPEVWDFPVTARGARGWYGRERGIRLQILPDGLIVEPEPYERRWVAAIQRAEVQQAQYLFKQGGSTQNFQRAAALLESARDAEPDRPTLEISHLLGSCYFLLRDFEHAEPMLKLSLRLQPGARQAIRANMFLSNICRAQGREQDAIRYQGRAMEIVGSDPELRQEYDRYMRRTTR